MRKIVFLLLSIAVGSTYSASGQFQATPSASELYAQLKHLNVLGSVLYIAAHPDDENTRLLAWLAKDQGFRTGYLSLTRGDGGQNLIGNEQGVDLGLIRTQELLAARRIDGAEQFFTSAYDFGFSKSSEESFRIWGKSQIQADVVWVIRKFQPDVIIARFPEDARAGHGHHAASGILAREAAQLAADPTAFPEQFAQGVSPWQVKRVLWNTFNFGSGTNTISEDQFKVDVGSFNPLTGKSYGEVAAESRSMHKSQGFGVPRSRGQQFEYFSTIAGTKPVVQLLDGVDTSWNRVPGAASIQALITEACNQFQISHPEKTIPQLQQAEAQLQKLSASYWRNKKLEDIQQLIFQLAGLFIDATSNASKLIQGDTAKVQLSAICRSKIPVTLQSILLNEEEFKIDQELLSNKVTLINKAILLKENEPLTTPFWLQQPMQEGRYSLPQQQLVGVAQPQTALTVTYKIAINGIVYSFQRGVQYRYTDPVRGEIYQPVVVVPPVSIRPTQRLAILNKEGKAVVSVAALAHKNIDSLSLRLVAPSDYAIKPISENKFKQLTSGQEVTAQFQIQTNQPQPQIKIEAQAQVKDDYYTVGLRQIQYDHIPTQSYFSGSGMQVLSFDLKTSGKRIGYIDGAGDYTYTALQLMGYEVVKITKDNFAGFNLSILDAIVTGVRAYNTQEWLNQAYPVLMQYVKNGGVLLVQYNTSNQIGPVKAQIGPYPFNISRNRITDESAKIEFLQPGNKLLQYPNKVSEKDFDHWVQERGIYFVDQMDQQYKTLLSMKDPNETAQTGSIIFNDYGKGRFIYTGLALFRQLPAGVPGAYRLLANLLAKPTPQ